MSRKISKVEVSPLFWKDLAEWRTAREYPLIRRQVSEMVGKLSRGEPGGDVAMKNRQVWEGISHMHVAAKLIVFLTYPDADTVRLCALKKHDFYGFGSEKKSVAGDAARKINNTAAKPPAPSPEWPSLRWSDPGEVAGHPELPELSREALDRLYREILDETDSFSRLERRIEGLHSVAAQRVADRWMDDLSLAQEAVEDAILRIAAMKRRHLLARDFEAWGREAGPGATPDT